MPRLVWFRRHLMLFALVATLSSPSQAAEPDADFTPMLNGRDVSGWAGSPGWWQVRDGVLLAESTPEHPCERSHYLTWQQTEPGDFELRLSYRIHGDANTGIQFRSLQKPDWDTWGYQADIDAAGVYTGCLYQHDRGLVAERGQKVVIDADGTKHIETFADSAELWKVVRPNDWNEYRILAQGSHIALWINDQLMCEVEDHEPRFALPKGIIALQMHQGPPMKAEFKDLRIHMLSAPKP